MTETKKLFWKSRTFWVNVIAMAAMIIQSQTEFIIEPAEQAAIIVVINLVLRAITKEGMEFKLSE